MAVTLTFTLSEAASVLDPPLSEKQLREIIHALGWKRAGYRHTGRGGHPFPVYRADDIFGLHAALVPFMGEAG